MTNSKSMHLVKGTLAFEEKSKVTFKMIPITKDCPYLEAIYHPVYHGLGVVGKFKKKEPVMMPILDKWGQQTIKDGKVLQDRRMIDSWHEYLLMTKEEVTEFINMFADNAETFDYQSFFPTEPLAEPAKQVVTEMKATVTQKDVVVN
jgi:hypothetical protein